MIFYGYVSHNQMASSPSSPSGSRVTTPDVTLLVVGFRKKPFKKAALNVAVFCLKQFQSKKKFGMMIIFRQTLGWYYLLSICNMFKHSNSWSDDPQWFCELRLRLERPATEGIWLPLGRCQASDQKSPKNKQKMVRERWEHHSSDPMFGGSAWI